MTATDESGGRLEQILKILSSLKGVREAFFLTDDMRAMLRRAEEETQPFGPLVVQNQGLLECLERQQVACIVKDHGFRPPPKPTVVLIDEDGTVIGRELLPGDDAEDAEGRKTLFLGKDFVIYYDGRSGRNARFVLPPVPFAEIEQLDYTERVCSCSPSTLGDLAIRRSRDLEDDPKLATVLIGFDLS